MRWQYGARLAPWISGLALVAGGCTPNASGAAGGSDAGADGRAARTAPTDAAPSDAHGSIEDAAPPDDTNLPAASGDELTARAKHLLEAIAHDNADLGVDMIFPRDAYFAARDTNDPGKQWDNKVVGAFRRSVHTMHRRSQGIERAQFVSFELGHAVNQITPRKKDWKRPLWRVHRSTLTYTVDGRTQRLEISELTSWRGNWYVTKLR